MIFWAGIALGILIVFHEFGHFIVAKKSGVGVLTFSIGFGPKILSRKIGETEYCVSAFPLGGYVKMVGEDPDQEVEVVDRERSFSNQSLLKRFGIVAAGPVFNFILAVILFAFIFALFGIPYLTTQVGSVKADSPAARAGIQKGDRIVAVNGEPIAKFEDLSKHITASEGNTLSLLLERDGRELAVSLKPEKGEGVNVFGETKTIWLIGIGSGGKFEIEKTSPWSAAWQGVVRTGEYSALTLVALYKMITGTISRKNLGGPILIAQMAGETARHGNFLFFVAILSVNLGVLNLLPIPILDGGHLLFFLLEGLRGRPLELRHRERAQQVGLFILVLVMIYAFYNDIARFFEG
ncbi:MAG: RIP metalloprotease RseP [Deltaproteobacteria bacterium]|nr:RIP metalloprotease RseP [Deltaproteobacteria bacterium]